MQHQVTTQLEVSAPAARVWAVLTEWGAYPDWNPFIRQIAGHPAPGERLSIRFQLAHGRTVRFRPHLQTLTAGSELCWAGYLWVPGLLWGEQRFSVERVDETRTLLVQSVSFRGLLVPLMWRSLKRTTRRGFMLMNAALKGRIEQYGKENRGNA